MKEGQVYNVNWKETMKKSLSINTVLEIYLAWSKRLIKFRLLPPTSKNY